MKKFILNILQKKILKKTFPFKTNKKENPFNILKKMSFK